MFAATTAAMGRMRIPSSRRLGGLVVWHRHHTAAVAAGTSSWTVGMYSFGKKRKRPQWNHHHHHRGFATNSSMDLHTLYRYLRLEKYTQDELEDRFQTIVHHNNNNNNNNYEDDNNEKDNSKILTEQGLRSYLSEQIQPNKKPSDESKRQAYIDRETTMVWNFLQDHRTKDQFVDHCLQTAKSIDAKRLWPLTVSMVMIGLSVGVTTPAFPFVGQNLGLTTGEYGIVISAFGLTKLFGNIPFAVLVERDGRKPYLVYTLVAIATGVGCIGWASGVEELIACRLITGLGVAGLSCAATMMVTDISTPLNRASSFAPISAGFAAGTALGPALGGVLIDQLGVNPTFTLVGGSFLLLGAFNSILLDETLRKHKGLPWEEEEKDASAKEEEDGSIVHAFQKALGQWAPLLSQSPVRNVCIMNGFYWVALSGSQMTLLPLILTDPHGLSMTATQVGQVYMGMSVVQVLGNPLLAKVVDTLGAVPGIVGGCTLIAASMFGLPVCDPEHLPLVLGVWALGSTLLSNAPIAHITDSVEDSQRAQAIALLRTSGDVGFLVGASSVGWLSYWAGGLDTAMQSSSSILGLATLWYIAKNGLNSKLQKLSK